MATETVTATPPVTPEKKETPVSVPAPTPPSPLPTTKANDLPPRDPGRQKATFNLQNIGKAPVRTEEKKEDKPLATAVDKPLEIESLKKVWNEFAELRKNQLAEYHLLRRDFTLKDNIITITLNNPIEEPLLQGMRTSLIAYLRDKLGNSSILVNGKLEEVETKRAIYTNKEKFDHLAEKNPLLQKLQERFGLDPDF